MHRCINRHHVSLLTPGRFINDDILEALWGLHIEKWRRASSASKYGRFHVGVALGDARWRRRAADDVPSLDI